MALWGPKLSLPLLLPDRCFGHRPARRHGRWAYDGTKLLSYAGSEEVTLTQAASAVEWTHVDGEFTCPLSVNVGRGQTTLKIQFTDKTIELGSETPNQDQTNVLSAITQDSPITPNTITSHPTQNASKRLFMPIGSAFFRERLLNAEDWASVSSCTPLGGSTILMRTTTIQCGLFVANLHPRLPLPLSEPRLSVNPLAEMANSCFIWGTSRPSLMPNAGRLC
eukprot:scaffold183620_cov26-Tisochrysis_lutea.AAC.1